MLKPDIMNTKKIFLFRFLILFFILLDKHSFAGTGGPNDGQVMVLVILAILLCILGILYFFPLLIHRVHDLWKRFHHC